MSLIAPGPASPISAAPVPFYSIGRFPNTTPFTYRDGSTFAEMFEQWIGWVENTVIPEIVRDVNVLVDAYNVAQQSLADAMDEYKDEIASDRAAFEATVTEKIADMQSRIDANAAAMQTALTGAQTAQTGSQAAQVAAEAARDAAQGWAAGTQALQDAAVKTLVTTPGSLTVAALQSVITPSFIGLGKVANLSPTELVTSQPFADAFGNLPKTVDGISQDGSHDITLNPYDAFYGIRYMAFGHSFGVVQNIRNAYAASVYPERVADILEVDRSLYVNATVSGQRMNGMLATVQATWNRGTYGIASIMCAANDLGNGTDATSWKNDLTSAMNWIRGLGPFPPTIVLIKEVYWTQKGYNRYSTPPSDATIDLWNTYIDQVAATFPSDGSVIVVDPRPGWTAATMTAYDGQHPNERGQAHISRAIVKALRNRPYREGQNHGIATSIPYFYDSFNRDNNDTGIGYNIFGQGYTHVGGDPAGILSNRARRVGATAGAGDTLELQNTGYSNVDISVQQSDPGTKGNGLVFRYSNATNFLFIDSANTTMQLYKQVNGVNTKLGAAQTIAGLDRVRVTAVGNNITVYKNDVQLFTVTDSFNATATMHGIRFAGNDSRLDDLVIKPL